MKLVFMLSLILLNSCRTTGESSSPKIVGGLVFTEMPEVGILTRNGKMHCTATLIAPNKILTAAHCLVKRYDSDAMAFAVGAELSTSTSTTVKVRTIHPRYDPDSFTNDVAYAELETALTIPPAKIFKGSVESIRSKPILLVGYGKTSSRDSGPAVKHAVEMGIAALNAGKIRFEEQGKSSCDGDSGGPAFVKTAEGSYEIVGVTSCGGYSCDTYGVYTRIDAYPRFIANGDSLDADIPIQSCGAFQNKWRCDGQELKLCTKDCFDVAYETKACLGPEGAFCWDGPITSRCVDATQQMRKLRFVTVRYQGDGSFTQSAMSGRTVFFNDKAFYANTSSAGEIDEYFPSGPHSFTLRKDDMDYAPVSRHRFRLDEGQEFISFLLGNNDIQITALYEASAKDSLYVTGPGPLFNEGQLAFRMTRKDSKWIYKDALPSGMPFQLVRAPFETDVIESNKGVLQTNPKSQTIPSGQGSRNSLKEIIVTPEF